MHNLKTIPEPDSLNNPPMRESLQDVIRRGILMAGFRVSTQGEDIYVYFGTEAHKYPKPDDSAIARIVAAFAPAVKEPEMDTTALPLDEAVYDG